MILLLEQRRFVRGDYWYNWAQYGEQNLLKFLLWSLEDQVFDQIEKIITLKEEGEESQDSGSDYYEYYFSSEIPETEKPIKWGKIANLEFIQESYELSDFDFNLLQEKEVLLYFPLIGGYITDNLHLIQNNKIFCTQEELLSAYEVKDLSKLLEIEKTCRKLFVEDERKIKEEGYRKLKDDGFVHSKANYSAYYDLSFTYLPSQNNKPYLTPEWTGQYPFPLSNEDNALSSFYQNPGMTLNQNLLGELKKFIERKSFNLHIWGESKIIQDYAVEYLAKESKLKSIRVTVDDNFSLMDAFDKGADILVFVNFDSINRQQQYFLWKSLVAHGYGDKFIFCSKTASISERLWGVVNTIELPSVKEFSQNLSQAFLSVYMRALDEIHDFPVIVMTYMDKFRELIPAFSSLECLEEFLDIIFGLRWTQRYLRSAEFWYIVSQEYIPFEKERLKEANEFLQTKKLELKVFNYFVYRGDYWEVCLGYPSYILLKDLLGIYYIVYLLKHPNEPIEVTELRKRISSEKALKEYNEEIKKKVNKNPKYEHLLSVKSVMKSIKGVIDSIQAIEQECGFDSLISRAIRSDIGPDEVRNDSVVYTPKGKPVDWLHCSDAKRQEPISLSKNESEDDHQNIKNNNVVINKGNSTTKNKPRK